MATRQPLRTRRRTAPAASLPRPVPTDGAAATSTRPTRQASGHRTHHVTTDYHYVRKDLYTIVGVGAVCMAFIVGMALYIG